uniref:Uncharacterized protein n=1 Tax=Rousettus aegyptiacus TaxID=9407 RepID=A0A7J8CIN5_ROUAE|nr:hypothetical protein HJG63_009152 [Rousettus aegyptiacus]
MLCGVRDHVSGRSAPVTLNNAVARSHPLKESLIRDFVMPCIGGLEDTGSVSCAALSHAGVFYYTKLKSLVMSPTADLTRKQHRSDSSSPGFSRSRPPATPAAQASFLLPRRAAPTTTGGPQPCTVIISPARCSWLYHLSFEKP